MNSDKLNEQNLLLPVEEAFNDDFELSSQSSEVDISLPAILELDSPEPTLVSSNITFHDWSIPDATSVHTPTQSEQILPIENIASSSLPNIDKSPPLICHETSSQSSLHEQKKDNSIKSGAKKNAKNKEMRLFKTTSNLAKPGRFPNLLCYDKQGLVLTASFVNQVNIYRHLIMYLLPQAPILRMGKHWLTWELVPTVPCS